MEKDNLRYFPKPIPEWLFSDEESDEVQTAVPEVPNGLLEDTLDTCEEAAALEIALDAGPDGMSFEEAVRLIEKHRKKK